jgi:hypothetical protein
MAAPINGEITRTAIELSTLAAELRAFPARCFCMCGAVGAKPLVATGAAETSCCRFCGTLVGQGGVPGGR